ncbi:MAG: hypothetical protein ABSD98_12850 [Candidatus Korobacteraceae bacterium]
MPQVEKPIRLSGHARQQIEFRGAWEQEVVEAIRNERWKAAEGDRNECRRDFVFAAMWNKKRYATKQVRPVFVEESDEIVVVTLYVYYF